MGVLAMTTTKALQKGASELQLVSFEVSGEEFAVDILAVQEINRMMELTRVPQSPPEVEGVINLRGKIIPVLDLRRKFGMGSAERTEANRIIVVDVNKKVLGFIVDKVHEVLRISSEIVEPAPAMACSINAEFISGVAKLEDRLIILLDLTRLFGDGQAKKAA
jgi:purine-binding chemotaxis protein CheW